MDAGALRLDVHARIAALAAPEWDALADGGPPFVRHAFLAALEASGAVAPATGFTSCHLTVRDPAGTLLAALPLHLKTHSFGEFVFDFAWAEAARRAGRPYYPRLVAALPFTPVTSAKPLLAPGVDRARVLATLDTGLERLAAAHGAGGVHILHLPEADAEAFAARGFVRRAARQFLWQDAGYGDHAGFLAAQTQARRKKVRQEMRRVAAAGVDIDWVDGHALAADADLAALVYACYARTYAVRGQAPYLPPCFWAHIWRDMPTAVQVALARRAGRVIAAAICFRDATTLYGRHWGALESVPDLHFVLCYHAGIARCLELGLRHFDPGVQGEHKVWRGFAPTLAWSVHRLADAELHAAVAGACAREQAALVEETALLAVHLPFRRVG